MSLKRQKPDANSMLYTPIAAVQQSTEVSRWLNRPLLTNYYREMGGDVGQSGLDMTENFLEITTRTNTLPHWPTDVSINVLPVLWSCVGWIPMCSKRPDAVNKRFRGGYLYAEVMGPYQPVDEVCPGRIGRILILWSHRLEERFCHGDGTAKGSSGRLDGELV
jgi:hypothetical protein